MELTTAATADPTPMQALYTLAIDAGFVHSRSNFARTVGLVKNNIAKYLDDAPNHKTASLSLLHRCLMRLSMRAAELGADLDLRLELSSEGHTRLVGTLIVGVGRSATEQAIDVLTNLSVVDPPTPALEEQP